MNPEVQRHSYACTRSTQVALFSHLLLLQSSTFVSHLSPVKPAGQWQLRTDDESHWICVSVSTKNNINRIVTNEMPQDWWRCTTHLPKTPFFEHLARSCIATGVAITSVYHVLTVLAVVPGRAATHVLTFRQRLTLTAVSTRECKAGVTLGQDLVADATWKRNTCSTTHRTQ